MAAERLRVCVVTAAYPAPSEPTRAVFLENFLAALAGEGIDSTVVAPRVAPQDPLEETRRGIEVARFRYPSGSRRLKEAGRVSAGAIGAYLAAGLRRALGIVRRHSPALIYAHWVIPAGVIGAATARLRRLPLVVHAHGSDVHRYALSSRASRLACRWVLARATSVLAVSRDLAARMERDLGLATGRASIVPMGVDGSVFHPQGREESRRALGLDDDRLDVLFVGDLDRWKGILPLARAVVADAELGARSRLHVVGDGELRGELEQLAATGETLRLHGRLDPVDVARWCRAADLLVLPSRGEGAPLAVMEALRSGLPVLATPVGGVPELVDDGRNGWLAAAEAFPERLRELVRDRERLGAARSALLANGSSGAGALDLSRRAREAAAILRDVAGRSAVRPGGSGGAS